MRRAVVALAFAALAWPGAALAKEVKSVAVCGATACDEVGGGQSQQFIALFQDPPDLPGGSGGDAAVGAVLDPVPVGSYYRVVVTMGGGGERTFRAVFFYVKPNLFRLLDENGALSIPFRRIDASFVREVERIADGLEPYPAPRVIAATVNDKAVAHPAKLIELFDGTRVEPGIDSGQRFATVYLRPDRANPWFTANVQFLYKPDTQLLILDEPLKVDRDTAALLADAGGFPLPAADGGRDWIRPAGFGVVVVALALAAALALVRTRRRPGPATA